MHPNGQIPAYEWELRDVNPPVHAWACWRVYKISAPRGRARHAVPRAHLSEAAAQLHLVGEPQGRDRASTSSPAASSASTTSACSTARSRCPTAAIAGAGRRHGVDGVLLRARCSRWRWSWPATDPAYEDIASKFFEHFVADRRCDERARRHGLWDEEDGFYYDQLLIDGRTTIPLRVRSLVGIIPLLAVEVLDQDDASSSCRAFSKRMRWFLEHRADLAQHVSYMEPRRGRRAARDPAARHPVARTAGAGAALPARRERIPLALRRSLAVARL